MRHLSLKTVQTSLALLIIGAFLTMASAAQAQGTSFLSVLEDVPLPQGMIELQDLSIVFDAPTGRIVQAVAAGPGDEASVVAFYKETLPPLGWEMTGSGIFERSGEVLSIDLDDSVATGIVVKFSLAPGK